MEEQKEAIKSEFINEQKILDYLQNEIKIPLVGVDKFNSIVVKSTIGNIKKLVEFVEPLHYYVRYQLGALYITPK